MSARVNLTGADELRAVLEAMVPAVKAASRAAVVSGQALLVYAARASMTVANPEQITPSPAPPGSPPAVVSGALRRSITMGRPSARGMGYSGAVYPIAVYARIQEMGGVTGVGHATTLPPRPYLAPALHSITPKFYDLTRDLWAAAIRST